MASLNINIHQAGELSTRVSDLGNTGVAFRLGSNGSNPFDVVLFFADYADALNFLNGAIYSIEDSRKKDPVE